MATHPSGITVEIVGTNCSNQGRSCEEHDICGSVLAEDVVVRFRKVQVLVNDKEESAIGVYLVSDGIDCCCVGFLQRHLVKHWEKYEGVLAQIIEVYGKDSESSWKRKKFYHHKGFCIAAIISHLPDDTVQQMSQRKRSAESDFHQTKQQRMIESTNNNDNNS